jgi:hypothetical protein
MYGLKPVHTRSKDVPQGLLNAAKVMSSSQVELPKAAEAELRGK